MTEPSAAESPFSAPSFAMIVRLVEQSAHEHHETRKHLDARIDIADDRIAALDKKVDWLHLDTTAEFLAMSTRLEQTQKHVERIDEHLGLLTAKVAAHDKRFDEIDARLDAHDKRFDAIDERLDAHDKRFDAIDKRFDNIDANLLTIFSGITGIQRSLAGKKAGGRRAEGSA